MQIPTVMWGFVVLWLSLLPKVEVDLPFQFKAIDKFVHISFYWILSCCLLYGQLLNGKIRQEGTNLMLLLLVVLFGGIIELLQNYVVITRTGEWADFAANTLGVILAYFLFKKIKEISNKVKNI